MKTEHVRVPIVLLRPFEQRYGPYREQRHSWNEIREGVPPFYRPPAFIQRAKRDAVFLGVVFVMLLVVLFVDHAMLPYAK